MDGYFKIKYGSAGFGTTTQLPIYTDAGRPEAVFPPEPIEIDVPLGGEETVTFNLSNIGEGDLIYVIALDDNDSVEGDLGLYSEFNNQETLFH